MNTSESQLQTAPVIHIPSSAGSGPLVTRRLVVILLEAEEEAVLASRILVLASARYQRVLLLGVCLDPSRQTELRRRLVTIAAFLREKRLPTEANLSQSRQGLSVEIRIERGKDWIEKIKAVLRPDDALACYDEQNTGRGKKRLCDVLSSNLELPIYVFSGLHPSDPIQRNILSQAASWLGSIASLGGFFLLQARILGATQGALQTLLLILTLLAEVGVIWIWNSLFM